MKPREKRSLLYYRIAILQVYWNVRSLITVIINSEIKLKYYISRQDSSLDIMFYWLGTILIGVLYKHGFIKIHRLSWALQNALTEDL